MAIIYYELLYGDCLLAIENKSWFLFRKLLSNKAHHY